MGCKSVLGVLVLLLLTPFAAARTLNTYPVPFVKDGQLADDLVIVVGDQALASDVASANDVANQLYQAAVAQQQARPAVEATRPLLPPSPPPAPRFSGGQSVQVGSTSDLLELNEPLGDVRESFTVKDLDILKGGEILTDKGRTRYNQFIRFSSDKGKVIFGEDEKDVVGDFLFWDDNDHLFTWELEFEQGLESKLVNGRLQDLEDEDIYVAGAPYVIADAEFQESTGRLKLTLLGGAISSFLGDNEKEIFTIDGKDHTVEVVVISEVANQGAGSVKFKVDGEFTKELGRGETAVLSSGLQIGVSGISATAKVGQKSIVQFYIGAQKLEFEDRNALDNNPSTASVRVNGNIVQDADLKINAVVKVAGQQVTVSRITYRLFADAVLGDIFIPPGGGLRKQLRQPSGMLSPAWDVVYEGLQKVGTTRIELDPSGDDDYQLMFTNQEGIRYEMPLVSNEDADGKLKYGDKDDDLWFVEANSDTVFFGTRGDFFVLSNCATTDNTCFTHVVQYSSADVGSAGAGTITLGFDDLGTGRRDVTMSNSSGKFAGELIVGGVSYKVFGDSVFNQGSAPNISVDLNGDGSVNGKEALIGVQGEGLIDLGSSNTNAPNTEGAQAVIDGNAVVSLTTLRQEFDEATTDETIAITIEPRANNRIGMTTVAATAGTLFGLFRTRERNQELGMSKYGILFDFTNPGGTESAEKLRIEYPLTQRGGDVKITVASIVQPEVSAPRPLPSPAPVAQPSVPPVLPRVKLASEVGDITQNNAIVVGGPCANAHAARLYGNPVPCWESIPLGVGVIRTVEHPNGKSALIIAGREALDTRRASLAVTKGYLAGVPSERAEVRGQDAADINIKVV